MKNTSRILITLLATVILSCNQSDPAPAPAITKFSPPFASRGSSVTIEGANFSTDPLANEIRFNGEKAVLTSSTATKIVATVPWGAISGVITAKVNGLLAASDSVFYVNMINGHWQLDNAIYSFCTDPADNGIYVCPDDDCFRIHIGETKSYYSYMNDYSPEYNYTITDKEITIFDGTDFTAQYSIYNLSLVLVYLYEGCVVTETYHIY